ncbi:MarR family transcriptional regulator [Jiangella aurantiaca]|uniref:MarR family transcriptional regulator n=1 Tax=Jiangella aurantiaca TaxID=2530373 RepID=A0A4R5A0R7_9ACTN|nr:helix-turn-helix domain-containing GNAT family N-acetyltransferase [Jiangella aurantiaca]TDD65353.1 MarR family transcriptional regulator [Jiangella aurantiaca]
MDETMVAQVRRFNRVVTQQVGALNDRFLARDRPLGESRLLWEIGADGRDVRSLRTALDLDSGYVSRLLRSLESAGLVATEPSGADRRVRLARLTDAGRAERRLLDERSDELAALLLATLPERQRERLVAAMAEVERLLTAATVRVAPADPDDAAARHCLRAYAAELNARFEGGFDPARSIRADAADLRPPAGLLLVATLHGAPVGCGALKLHGAEPAELKRMWVDESARGLGIGRRLLAELERHAAEHGAPAVRLETNAALTEAIALYRSAGYAEVPAFNAEPYAHHWFEKPLPPQA